MRAFALFAMAIVGCQSVPVQQPRPVEPKPSHYKVAATVKEDFNIEPKMPTVEITVSFER